MNIIKNLKLCSLMLIPILFTGCENKTETINDALIQANNKIEMIDISEDIDIKEELETPNNLNNENNNANSNNSSTINLNSTRDESIQNTAGIEENTPPEANPIFTKSDIPDNVKQKMIGNSMSEDSTVSFDELSYLRISYIDYNGKTQVGEMVVNNKLADEVLDIFRDIYNAKFPIEKMNLIDEYGASDHKSMVDNNSSAFCYRTIAGTNKVSNHGLGVAIDINPFYNPHVLKSNGTVNPPEAFKYVDRSLNDKGIIKENDAVYEAFTSRGWKWGGHWSNPDYQHFEKEI